MTREDFGILLDKATASALKFAQEMVLQQLPMLPAYEVHLNQSCDEQPDSDSILFPHEDNHVLKKLSRDSVIDCLLRDGRCPEWIDISTHAVGPNFTVFRLLCCGRFTSNEGRLYYYSSGLGPFGVKSPDLPRSFQDGQPFPLQTTF
jgi:hypothetical protein